MPHLTVPSSVDRRLGGVHTLAGAYALQQTLGCRPLYSTPISVPLDANLVMGLLGHTAVLQLLCAESSVTVKYPSEELPKTEPP